jgi:hypothetical protein
MLGCHLYVPCYWHQSHWMVYVVNKPHAHESWALHVAWRQTINSLLVGLVT